jgi:hypothetical protein
MNVPVSDRQRAKLEKIDALQRQTRSRIYDQLLSMEEKHPRPILNAAKRVQSLYRMVKGKVDVEEKKYRFYLAAQKKVIGLEPNLPSRTSSAANLPLPCLISTYLFLANLRAERSRFTCVATRNLTCVAAEMGFPHSTHLLLVCASRHLPMCRTKCRSRGKT